MSSKKRCLVTGGAGFIGSHIVDQLLEHGHEVFVVDNLDTGKRENLPTHVELIETSILDELDPVFEKVRPQIIFHEAAQISVSRSVREPKVDAETNVIGTINVLEAAKKAAVERIVYASSAAGYGEPQSLPMTEEHPMLSVSPYGITKLVVEKYLYCYRAQFGLPFVALRYANVYGPRQDPHGEAGVVAIFTEKLLGNEQTTIFGDGGQTRDFVHVRDVAAANLAAMSADIPNDVYPAFNVSTAEETTVNTIFDLLKKHSGSDQNRNHAPPRPGDPYRSSLDNSKIKRHLGWAPKIGVAEGLRETIEFFQAVDKAS